MLQKFALPVWVIFADLADSAGLGSWVIGFWYLGIGYRVPHWGMEAMTTVICGEGVLDMQQGVAFVIGQVVY